MNRSTSSPTNTIRPQVVGLRSRRLGRRTGSRQRAAAVGQSWTDRAGRIGRRTDESQPRACVGRAAGVFDRAVTNTARSGGSAAEDQMTGTDGARLLSFPAPTWPTKASESGRKSAPKITRNGSLPIRHATHEKRKTSAVKSESRLAVAETTYKGAKAWRVSLGKRGKDLLSFRVRPSGSGYFATWRSGNSERYICYLSAAEWQTARKGSPSSFARLIAAKLTARADAGEDLAKLIGLQDRLKGYL